MAWNLNEGPGLNIKVDLWEKARKREANSVSLESVKMGCILPIYEGLAVLCAVGLKELKMRPLHLKGLKNI